MGKFKVGDRIIQPGWHERDTCTVVSISETRITVRDDRGCTGSYTHLAPFVLVKPAITIEPGKHYRLRNGKVTGRVSTGDIGFEALVDGQVKVFDKAGGAVFGGGELDIVEAWVPKVGERVRLVKDGLSTTGAIGKAATIRAWSDGEHFKWGRYLLDIDPPVNYRTRAVSENFTQATLDCFEPLPVAAPAQPAVLTIQQGKFYKTRDGRKVGPMETFLSDMFSVVIDGTSRIFQSDGTHGSEYVTKRPELNLIAEWVDEPAVTASNDNVAPAKFKVGDRVVAVGDENDIGTVTKYADGLYAVAWSSHGSRPHDDLIWDEDELVAAPAPTAAIVALIEGGVAKPSSKPKVHASQADAADEAERLALAHPGQLFGVFVLADSKIADVVNVPTPVLRAA